MVGARPARLSRDQRARRVEIVAGEQGSAADAEMMVAARIERRRPARHGAFEMGEVGHVSYRPSRSASFFFCSSSIVLDVLVGDLLDLVEPLLLVVLGDLVILEQLLQPVVGVAAHLADAVAALLGQLVDVARQLLAALFGERRERDAHDLAVVGRVQAEIGGANRLLDRAELRRVERLRDDQRRLGNREAGDLVQRHLRAVGLDVDAVENRDRRAAGPHARRTRAARDRSRPSSAC